MFFISRLVVASRKGLAAARVAISLGVILIVASPARADSSVYGPLYHCTATFIDRYYGLKGQRYFGHGHILAVGESEDPRQVRSLGINYAAGEIENASPKVSIWTYKEGARGQAVVVATLVREETQTRPRVELSQRIVAGGGGIALIRQTAKEDFYVTCDLDSQ